MLEFVAAMDIVRRATRSAMEEEPSVRHPVERSPQIRPAVASGLRRLAKVVDVPSGRGGAKVPTSSS